MSLLAEWIAALLRFVESPSPVAAISIALPGRVMA